MILRALVVIGSRTAEDRYGVTSGLRVAEALRNNGWKAETIHAKDGQVILRRLLDDPPDVVVPVGFGPPCEDGHIFGACRLAGVPCAGPTPAAGALMQDKSALSRVVDSLFPQGSGIRSPRGFALSRDRGAEDAARLVAHLRLPLLVKPCFSGSSEGLLVFDSREDAIATATAMLPMEGKVLIQQLEAPVAHEVSCTVLDRKGGAQFLPIVELRRDDVAVMGVEEKFGAAGLDRHIIPAQVPAPIARRIRDAVLTLRDELGPVGLSRTDILVLPSGELVILELNAIPGLLLSSIACDAARAGGIVFEDLAVAYAESAWLSRPEPHIWDFEPQPRTDMVDLMTGA
jgi:D-alanine-D-alanine ligase